MPSTPSCSSSFRSLHLAARYAIDGARLDVSYEVTNEGDEDMPFFIGGHPGFACPLDEGESYDDYELRFDADEAATLCTAVPSTGLIDVENRTANPMVGRTLRSPTSSSTSPRPSSTSSRAATVELVKKGRRRACG